jgi:DNA processing protein
MLAEGLPGRVFDALRGGAAAEAAPGDDDGFAALREAAEHALRTCRRQTSVRWPRPAQVRQMARHVRSAGLRLSWAGPGPDYPARLARRLESPPRWLWQAGPEARFQGPICAVVGSRRVSDPLLRAAGALGGALSAAGVAVVSGMAAGADAAAHLGAAGGVAGTIGIPAQGLFHARAPEAFGPGSRWALMTPARPDSPFSAGLAVRRNALIAAMGDALVLVASDLCGGSSHAVRWALAHGTPLFCFEAGRATPPANRQLLRAGLARPLALADPPDAWVAAVLPPLLRNAAAAARPPAVVQTDWLADDAPAAARARRAFA